MAPAAERSLSRRLEELSAREGVSVDQRSATAVAEKTSALLTEEYAEERGKPKSGGGGHAQALASIYGMLKHNQDFEGEKFYRIPKKVPATA